MGNKTRRAAVGLCLAAACLTVVFGSGCAGGQQGTSAGSDRLVAEKSSVRATEYGDVVGVVSDGVEAYYNIPYGSDPTGDLRWHAPEAPKAWDGELDCSKSGKKALQMATVYDEDGNASVEQQGTTDCLNLDVYTSADAKDLPVLVYIHGGNNQTGTATEIGGLRSLRATTPYMSRSTTVSACSGSTACPPCLMTRTLPGTSPCSILLRG